MKTIALLVFVAVLAGCTTADPNRGKFVGSYYYCETAEAVREVLKTQSPMHNQCWWLNPPKVLVLLDKVGQVGDNEIWRASLFGKIVYLFFNPKAMNVQPPRRNTYQAYT